MRRASLLAGTLVLSALAAAAQAAPTHAIPEYIAAAVADSARPQADRERDAVRKPAETLAFSGVKPGDQVLELAPGRGYYTRLLSAIVGPRGKVYVPVSPKRPDAPPDAPVPGAAVKALAADPHYANVTVLEEKLADVSVPAPVDLVWTSQNYHDFHNVPDLEVAGFDKKILALLKPGGVYLVLDHAAEAGSAFRDTSTLHRIDPEAVKKEVESAGFKLQAESNLLRNKDDPHTAKVFDSGIQGHTDQFILKFTRPR